MTDVLDIANAAVVRDGKTILGPLTWRVGSDERWVVLGPNGAGKSTLFNLISTQSHPSSGGVKVLGCQLGKTDVFEIRPRIGYVSTSLLEFIPEGERVLDLVMSSAYAIVGRWQESYDLWDESRALGLLTLLGVREFGERSFDSLSDGEQKRVMIARALMPNPELLLLDEPTSGLDLGGREDLLQRLSALAKDPKSPAIILITHHVEEIPVGTTHCLLLKDGVAISAGRIEDVLTSVNLTKTYSIPLEVSLNSGRYSAKAVN